MLKPEQEYVGSVQGFANAHVFGYAYHDTELIYLDVVTTNTVATAIFASIQSGKPVAVNVNMKSRSVFKGEEKQGGEFIRQVSSWGKSGEFVKYVTRIPTYQMVHMVVHSKATDPEKYQLGTRLRYYMLNVDPENTTNILGQRIAEIVNCAVYPEWYRFLARNGLQENLIKKADCFGGILAYAISTSKKAWEELISEGLKQRLIGLPERTA